MNDTETPDTFGLFAEGWQQATEGGSNGNECVICGKATGKTRWFVNADDGPEWYGDDMGWHPIGPDCAKKAKAAGWQVEQFKEET